MSPNQILVLGTVRSNGPLTAYEISELTGMNLLAVKPRLNELVKSGALIAAGAKLNQITGRSNIAYSVAQK